MKGYTYDINYNSNIYFVFVCLTFHLHKPILSVGLTGEGISLLIGDDDTFSTAVKPRKGFKITPALNARESSAFVVKARSKTLSHLERSWTPPALIPTSGAAGDSL